MERRAQVPLRHPLPELQNSHTLLVRALEAEEEEEEGAAAAAEAEPSPARLSLGGWMKSHKSPARQRPAIERRRNNRGRCVARRAFHQPIAYHITDHITPSVSPSSDFFHPSLRLRPHFLQTPIHSFVFPMPNPPLHTAITHPLLRPLSFSSMSSFYSCLVFLS
jgi:hypothetical protein